ncbi:acid stress chaperone HdeA [Bowdeniella nasicola]|uniref:Acid stress chaperone HdeA n=1 Tax=Bowdeniella nasicola TaxID=208480 RepID=A0A1H3VMR0_9ACTO|nr:hypothetical protein [Bowdeniella nasicola]SDZ75398.1 acid stress chaperone HdeA [Bowdeniella nasicola]
MRKPTTLLAGVLALALLAGAGGCAGAKHAGGNTTCKDYLTLDKGDKRDAIKAFLSDSGKSDPSNAEISLSVMSATLYCKTAGSDSDPISNIGGN